MFGVRISKLGSASKLGLIAKAIAILRSYGADAHIYLPGVGTLSGITAGNYLDSAGTTAASVDNPVGLSLDALQAMTLGSERVVNGAFSTNDLTGWTNISGTWSAASGAAVCSAGTNATLSQNILTIGKRYQFTVDVLTLAGTILFYAGSGNAYTVTTTGTKTFQIDCAGDTLLYAQFSGASTGSIDNISVREIPGIHAKQGTTANKPLVRRGAYNLIAMSEALGTAPWSTTNATITDAQAANAGGQLTLCKVLANASVGANISQSFISSSTALTMRFLCRIGNIATRGNLFSLYNNSTASELARFTINYSTGAIAHSIGSGATATDLGGGLWEVKLTQTTGIIAGHAIAIYGGYIGNTATAGDFAYIGEYHVEAGTSFTTYTPTTTTAASNPSAGKYWWSFDGSNDSLSLSAPPFQMSDDHCVIAGVLKTASASDKYAFAVANSASATPLCAVLVLSSDGIAKAFWRGDDAVLRFASSGISYSGSAKVISARKVGNSKICRVNAVSGTPETSAIGATTLDASYIGVNTPAAPSYFDGSIYPVIAIKGTLSDSDLLVLERFVGQMSGVSI